MKRAHNKSIRILLEYGSTQNTSFYHCVKNEVSELETFKIFFEFGKFKIFVFLLFFKFFIFFFFWFFFCLIFFYFLCSCEGADPNFVTSNLSIVYHLCLRKNINLEMLEFFVEKKSDLSFISNKKTTLLHAICLGENVDPKILKYLIENGKLKK